MEKTTIEKIYKSLVIIVFCTSLFSCKTSREVVRVANLRPISTNRLIKNLGNNAFYYEEMEISRISCQYESNTQNVSFRGTIKAVDNKKILLTFSKMNVPVGKVLLTPDSVKFINYLDKNYFLNDYDYLSELLNIDLNFETINAILSNNAFSYREDKRDNDFREFTSEVDSGMYVLKSIKDRKLEKVMRKGKDKKIDRLLKKLDEDQLILQTLYIDSKFKLRKVTLEDQFSKRLGIIRFSNFMNVGRQNYPGEIDLQFVSPEDNLRMKIRIGKLTMEKNQNFNFKIPERYKRIN